MNGQIEFVNKSLGDSLSCLVGENPKQWEAMVVQAEFAYNYSRNWSIDKSPFEVVYGRQPLHLYDLALLLEMRRNSLKGESMVDLKKDHMKNVRLKIEELNAKHKKYAD